MIPKVRTGVDILLQNPKKHLGSSKVGLITNSSGVTYNLVSTIDSLYKHPEIDLKVIFHLFPYAAIISLLGFMEAISIAKAMAGKTGQRLDPNQELIGQGMANILGSIAKSYPTSGSFSRSAVNLQAGAISGLSSVFTSLAVVIVLLFFTPLLYHLPQPSIRQDDASRSRDYNGSRYSPEPFQRSPETRPPAGGLRPA